MLSAMRKQKPDRVPVCPDISNMVPCRLTGKPFWEIYHNNSPSLCDAYINAVKYFGMDGWLTAIYLNHRFEHEVAVKEQILSHTSERLTIRRTYHTPAGDLTDVVVYPVADSPTLVEKLIKDPERDFPAYKYFLQIPIGYDDTKFRQQKEALGELGISSISVYSPGLHLFVNHFQGGLESLVYAMNDYPAMIDEMIEMSHYRAIAMCKMAIAAGTDSILTGGSGSITLSSPELWRKHSLGTIKEITGLCREAGVISGIHSCGQEKVIVETCADETDLDYINPLEIPPMGDCTLAEARRYTGNRMCLMGNLHTTEVMLNGSAEDVKRESLRALLDAGLDGAFILSTGDQCGRDTPDKNIFMLMDTMREFGQYPVDADRIRSELSKGTAP
jgi:uroporphyrinogen decarboxylase